MAKVNNTDRFLYNRSDKTYQLEAGSIMAELLDDDYMLLNRANQTYRVSGADIKDSLGTKDAIDKPTITFPTNNLGITDPNAAPEADGLQFIATAPSGINITQWGDARWEVSDDNFASIMIAIKQITDPLQPQTLAPSERYNIDLKPGVIYEARVRYFSEVPVVGSEYSDVVRFKTAPSLDGWEITNQPLGVAFRDIAYGEPNGQPTYVALGNSSYYSYDLVTWTPIILDVPESTLGAMASVVYANGQFVAVGLQSGPTRPNNVMYSNDGVNWVVSAHGNLSNNGLSQGLWGLSYGNNVYTCVTTGGEGGIAYSTDNARSWISSTELNQESYSATVFGGGKFVAGGNPYFSQYSVDGINFTPVGWPANEGPRAFAYGNSTYVAVGFEYGYTSTTAQAWTIESLPLETTWNDVTFGIDKFVAVASSGTSRVMYSPDNGQSWITTPAPLEAWMSVIHDGQQFVAIADNGEVMVSKTGIGRAN